MKSLHEDGGKELFGSTLDPLLTELNRSESQLKDKGRELAAAHGEIKALKTIELLKEKAIMELSTELKKIDGKLQTAEKHIEYKNLEIKKLSSEKKEALAAKFAAEAALRRVHSSQRNKELVPIEAMIAPLESDIKMHKNEILILQKDKKALERLMKSKEAALLEAEKIVCSVLERALIVEDVQNQNFELKKQIEICQEENKLLDKTNRQKILEVEKLTQTIHKLKESVLAGRMVANAILDYQRQVSELNEEKRTLERELAKAKVLTNSVATVVAKGCRDENNKVMPVKQWLEERRFLQGEIQRWQQKMAASERTAKAEAQLKDKLKLRLKTLEESLKHAPSLSFQQADFHKAIGLFSHNRGPKKQSNAQPRASLTATKISIMKQPNLESDSTRDTRGADGSKKKLITGEAPVRKDPWASRSILFDDGEKVSVHAKANSTQDLQDPIPKETDLSQEVGENRCGDLETQNMGGSDGSSQDMVSGLLYDILENEVINLRKSQKEKDGLLNAKEEEIKMLLRKVDALKRAMDAESKKVKRETTCKRKEEKILKSEDIKQKQSNAKISKDPKIS